MPPPTPVERLFWGKTGKKQDDGTVPVHPLLCHMLDVAAVAQAMWRDVLPPAARVRLTTDLGLRNTDAAGRWVAFFVGAHDLGKASPAFAVKHEPSYRLLREAGLPCPSQPPDIAHGVVTACTLADALHDLRLDPRLIATLATTLGGHHGVFPRTGEVMDAPTLAVGKASWAVARAALVARLADALGVRRADRPSPVGAATAMVLAGLVSVADWIGSDERFFPYAQDHAGAPFDSGPAAYWSDAQGQARLALRSLRWTGWMPSAEPLPFSRLFPAIQAPNAVQRRVVEFAPKFEDQPGLVIVEAPMGQGKTEAAMYLADRWGAALGQRGCYFTLPTQATSNQMFSRVRTFLQHRYAGDVVNLQLLHGHAALSAELETLREHDRLLQPQGVYGDQETRTSVSGPAEVVAAEWFTARKRGLLAPFGVGTVDQGLLAVLQTRHVFVRLFGLAHKVVVIDEVHAYDTYMSALLLRLLEWLAALRASVVLLSATLPRQRRDRLAAAYARGLGLEAPSLPPVSYPRLTWVSSAGSGAAPAADRDEKPCDQAERTVRLDWVDGLIPDAPGAPFELGRKLKAALARGGCGAVICNTVRRAQAVYRALAPYFPGRADDGLPQLDLFHAQYLYEDREVREQRVLVRFGKDGTTVRVQSEQAEGGDGQDVPVRRPDCAVLVATQVIEQSLDLDFDLMVTDPAPADLVLQRSGRLHRHLRDRRPPGLEEPTLWMCRPETLDGDVPGFGRANEYVYAPHVLLRSWLALRDRDAVRVPGEVEELIEAVYDDSRPCPDGASDALQQKWRATRAQRNEEEEQERREAEKRWLKAPDYRGELWRFTADPREEDAPDFHETFQALTRLAEPTVRVVCLYVTAGGGGHLSFAPDSRARVNPAAKPTVAQTRRLLRRSVTISDPRVVRALLAQDAPSGWKDSALLRHYRLVELDADRNKLVGKYQFHVDDVLGVTITPLEGGA